MTHNEHLAPSMLWEMQHCKKQTKETKNKTPKRWEAKKEAHSIEKILHYYIKLKIFFSPKDEKHNFR